ncbi:S41 family peptidase [Methanomicrobium mobile]|uniref:S41 family peptidase n=1 Tax=Methanomicrobium mobile TaxID=2205 RepID=UPI0005B2AB2B|nr:S41 family peptidase [Methanomicrobium mobile]
MAGCTAQTQDTATADNTHGKVSEKSMPFDPNTASVSSKTVALYFVTAHEPGNTTLYFVNGGEIPYISIEEYLGYLEKIGSAVTQGYNLTFKADGDKASFVRENGYSADFDFQKNTVHFTDYNMFTKTPNGPLLDVTFIHDNVAQLFQKDEDRSYERYGEEITIPLSDYGIGMLHKDGGYYIPLQTFSDLFMATKSTSLMYNGEVVIIEVSLTDELSEIYYSVPKSDRSKEAAEFDYNELCLALDHYYGLKEVHRIKNFDAIFHDCGYDYFLKGTNQTLADIALYQFLNTQLDDLHSGFKSVSFRTDKEAYDKEVSGILRGYSGRSLIDERSMLQKARAKYYPNGVPHYEEVGNTAYITFDSFDDSHLKDYYSVPKENELDDNIRLMQYAYDRITRKGSPIKNVVMDLSINTGGAIYDALYVTGLFLEEAQISAADELTGALTSAHYRVDINRDHVFDEKDTLAGKGYNLYCLESRVSFSCGNLVPNIFKDTTHVTLIGQTSGGGSCAVQPLSTSSGSLFQVSGNKRMSFIKNGAFYDIDRGADPDIYIHDLSVLYDRKKLTDYINNNII